jgi:NAD+ synthase (glutamine-hydrolysing)
MKHGFIKVASATPNITVADCSANIKEMLKIWKSADIACVDLLVFPELSITGSTCADLFLSDTLLKSAESELSSFLKETSDSSMISIIGFPAVVNDKIYNCAVICQKGQILGVVPKNTLANYKENCDSRYFTAYTGETISIKLCGSIVPFASKIIFECNELSEFRFGVEIGAELSSPIPPSTYLCEAGSLIVANLAASCETVGTDDYRKLLVRSHSARNLCGYIYANSGNGESTTDLVFSGHSMIAENGVILSERAPFSANEQGFISTEIDVQRLSNERRKQNTFSSVPNAYVDKIYFSIPLHETKLTRYIDPSPFIPSDPCERAKRCDMILEIQSRGLATRIERAYAKKCVIGISGGLDSCLAILVAARALDLLGRPRTDIIGVTMPCFGTTKRTRSNAEILCDELGADMRCVDISEAVRLHFRDIGHNESDRNVVYENCQARERTQVIMDIANKENGLVVGTGDLSELALGWATYNGDHMSMYGVNGGVPKTLIRHIVSFCADNAQENGKKKLSSVLRDILDTPVSPELLPANENGEIAQKTEDLVGPYELHDFYLYYMIRLGYSPDKLYRVAKIAFSGAYSDAELLKWLKNFVRRFFNQQFKRSCLPDGPKVGSVGVSPRGDLKMPSDASSYEWLKITEEL